MDKKTHNAPADKYRGVDVDKADKGKVDAKLVDEDTSILNNNPLSDDGPDPYKGHHGK